MEQDLQQIINDKISVLPEKLRKHLAEYPWQEKLRSISDKNSLNENQKFELKKEVFLILAGLEQLQDLRKNLIQDLKISYDQSIKISTDLNDQVFGPVINELKITAQEIQKNDEAESNTTKTPTPEVSETSPEPLRPDHTLPDHEQMTKTDGPHLHSQNVMPAATNSRPATTATAPAVASATPKLAPIPAKPVAPTAPAFKSIVDQKLSGMVRSSNAPANLPMSEKDLAEMMKKSEGVTMGGYKGIDPYREPIE